MLRGVDLAVSRGEVVALVGEAGTGKSTLLRCLAGLEAVDAGSVDVEGGASLVDGTDDEWLPQLGIGHHLKLACRGDAGQARDLLARVGLARRFDDLPGSLGAGERQRVRIARALASEPALLLCDEAAPGFDGEVAGEVAAAALALAADGLAVLLATADPDFARAAADRVLWLRRGRVHEATAPQPRVGRGATAWL